MPQNCKGYASDALLQLIAEQNAMPVISAKKHRTQARDYDQHLYKERHRVSIRSNGCGGSLRVSISLLLVILASFLSFQLCSGYVEMSIQPSTTSQYITDDAIARLKQVDFRESFALIAFDGLKTEVQHDFQIQRIVRRQDNVLIIAQPSRKSGPVAQGAISSLYHLVKIKKEGKWEQLIVFELYFQNNQPAVATLSHSIP